MQKLGDRRVLSNSLKFTAEMEESEFKLSNLSEQLKFSFEMSWESGGKVFHKLQRAVSTHCRNATYRILGMREPPSNKAIGNSSDGLTPQAQSGRTHLEHDPGGHNLTCIKLVGLLSYQWSVYSQYSLPSSFFLNVIKLEQSSELGSLRKTKPSAWCHKASAKFVVSLVPGGSEASGKRNFEILQKLL